MENKKEFVVFGTLYQFVGWLEDWLMAHNEMGSVQVLHDSDGTKTASMFIPEQYRVKGTSNQIIFNISYKSAEHLNVIAIYEDNETINEYADDLITAIIFRWSKYIEAPNFEYIVDDEDLAKLLKQRWIESELAFRSEAFLSALILLGSILEGVLFHKAERNPKACNHAKSTPKSQGKPKPFSEWKLNDLITVARELGWLDKDIHDASDALRDYRNLIHPKEQLKRGIFPDEGTVNISKSVILAALADLEKIK